MNDILFRSMKQQSQLSDYQRDVQDLKRTYEYDQPKAFQSMKQREQLASYLEDQDIVHEHLKQISLSDLPDLPDLPNENTKQNTSYFWRFFGYKIGGT